MDREKLRSIVHKFNKSIGFRGGVKKPNRFKAGAEETYLASRLGRKEQFLSAETDPASNIGVDLIMKVNGAT